MSRIRTVKPEFWASEQIMELSIQARLCFIGLWTFADDNGVHPASPKTLKAEVFPADDLTADVVSGLIAEMVSHGLVGEFEADGKRYWFVTGWHRHQRIDRPTFKHPEPPTGKLDEQSANTRRVIDEQSTSNRPRKGKEGKGENTCAIAPHDDVPEGFADCWKAYPKREGGNSRTAALKAYKARVKQGEPVAELIAGVERYAAFVRAKGQEGTSYVKQASTFFGPGEHWKEPWDVANTPSKATLDPFLGAI